MRAMPFWFEGNQAAAYTLFLREASMRLRFVLSLCLLGCGLMQAQEVDNQLPVQATSAMHRAARFYREKVASHGGYVYHYSLDLKRHGVKVKRRLTKCGYNHRAHPPSDSLM